MTRTTAATIVCAAFFAAALLIAPRDARAFNRESAEGTGKPLYWQDLPITYTTNAACAGTMEVGALSRHRCRALGAWPSPGRYADAC